MIRRNSSLQFENCVRIPLEKSMSSTNRNNTKRDLCNGADLCLDSRSSPVSRNERKACHQQARTEISSMCFVRKSIDLYLPLSRRPPGLLLTFSFLLFVLVWFVRLPQVWNRTSLSLSLSFSLLFRMTWQVGFVFVSFLLQKICTLMRTRWTQPRRTWYICPAAISIM